MVKLLCKFKPKSRKGTTGMTQQQQLTACVPAGLNAEELGDKSGGKNISYFPPSRDFTMKLNLPLSLFFFEWGQGAELVERKIGKSGR